MTAARRWHDLDAQAIDWLLTSDEPGIRLQTRRDLLDEKVELIASELAAGPIVVRLLAGQRPDGGFGVHPYQKWMGAHWRLVSLVELGVQAGDSRVDAALESVLQWIGTDERPEDALRIRELYRVHGSSTPMPWPWRPNSARPVTNAPPRWRRG